MGLIDAICTGEAIILYLINRQSETHVRPYVVMNTEQQRDTNNNTNNKTVKEMDSKRDRQRFTHRQ